MHVRLPALATLTHLAALMMAVFIVATCSELAAGSPLAHARRSPEALANAALEALAAGDEQALRTLMISRDEYETMLWPALPDREYVPFAFVWSITEPRNRKARAAAISEYRDTPLELVRVDLGDDTEEYANFILYRDVRMLVRRTDTGTEGVLPLMDAVVEMQGGWKFLNFGE